MMNKYGKERLFEVMGKLDTSFEKRLNENIGFTGGGSNKTTIDFLDTVLDVVYEYAGEEEEVTHYGDGSGYPRSAEEFYVYEVYWDESNITDYFSEKGLKEITKITGEKIKEDFKEAGIKYGERNL